MRCDECCATLLAGETDERVVAHLAGCSDCRADQGEIERTRLLLADQSIWEEPPSDLVDRVVDTVAGSGPGRPATRTRPRPWGRVLSAAAVFLVAVGSFALLRADSPDWEVALPGTELAPLASGSVKGWNTESGTRMLLEVDGLPRAPDGFFYEFWLSEGPVHISAGTFSSAEQVELFAAVKRADFPRLWVTLEPIDEDESPTRETVLDTGRA